MFGQLMAAIDDDYVRYVIHVQVLAEHAEEPDYAQAEFVAAADPVAGLGRPCPGAGHRQWRRRRFRLGRGAAGRPRRCVTDGGSTGSFGSA